MVISILGLFFEIQKGGKAMITESTMERPFAAKFAQEFSGRQTDVGGSYDAVNQQRSWPDKAQSDAYPTMFPTHCGVGQIDDERPGD
jgi:hypothetical protein